jgi:AcrR family transcriptional regulator
MSSTDELPRRTLSGRPADTVARLLEATVVELRSRPAKGLTVRSVARRAGVAPATAYTYFSSRDHLVTEVFWQRLQSLPDPVTSGGTTAGRAGAALSEVATLVADEPELAAACTQAMLADDPEVRRLRDSIGAAIVSRLVGALGDDADDTRLRALGLAFSGAMLQAGMGHLDYEDLPEQLSSAASLILGGHRVDRPATPANGHGGDE